MIARAPGCSANCGSSASHSGSPGTTTRPVPCSRTMFGGPSKAQNITVTRPFCRMCAMPSAPLPVRSR